jgi:hypothetical protein
MNSRIDHAYLRSAVAEGGGEWVGIQEGTREHLVLFNDPVGKSTLSLRVSDVTPEAVGARIQQQRDIEIRYLARLKPFTKVEDFNEHCIAVTDQAKAREQNHAFWKRQYTFERRAKNIFFGIMALLLLLAIAVPWLLILYGKFGRP